MYPEKWESIYKEYEKELNDQLHAAVTDENYELAATLRDEIGKRS